MTANFESPSPHFYPRFFLDKDNNIRKEDTGINSLSKFRKILKDDNKWGMVKKELIKYDSFYDPLVFEKGMSDYSVYARLIKRAWGQKIKNENINSYHNSLGFKNHDNLINITNKLVSNFIDNVRKDKAIPYIILFNDRGYDNHLYSILKSTLETKNVYHYSTHKKFPATRLSNFIADGHFKPEIDQLIGKDIYQDLQKITNN